MQPAIGDPVLMITILGHSTSSTRMSAARPRRTWLCAPRVGDTPPTPATIRIPQLSTRNVEKAEQLRVAPVVTIGTSRSFATALRNWAGNPCRALAMPNGRCQMHGGESSGPGRPGRTGEDEAWFLFSRGASAKAGTSACTGGCDKPRSRRTPSPLQFRVYCHAGCY
jgi:hypothetical protein